MPVTEKSALLFSSGCHLELVILENSEFFAYYFDKDFLGCIFSNFLYEVGLLQVIKTR